MGELDATARRLIPVLAGGLLVVLPWLARNASAFGTPFPGQTLENAVLRRNEDIYAFAERPTLASYLDQDLATLLGNPIAAAWDALLNVIVLPAFPIGIVGLATALVLRRSPAFALPGSLGVLLMSGVLTLVSTVLLFPVASRWGTYLHASGPLLVALTVAAVLGADVLLARISAIRGWPKPNVIIGPIALAAIVVVLLGLQVLFLSRQARTLQERYATVRSAIEAAAAARGEPVPGVVVSDHPIWLAEALERASAALPDEDVASLVRLSRTLDATWLVVVDRRGRYPDDLLSGVGRACLSDDPVSLGEDRSGSDASPDEAWLFILDPRCEPAAASGA
jgi:hypothetical protein